MSLAGKILRVLQRHNAVSRGRLELLNQQLANEVADIRAELATLKSSLEVSPEMREEFHLWRQNHAVPREPLVSVTINTYNRARLLVERSIPSILQQSYERLELIVVGDGCTDDTERRVRDIRDPRFRFVNLPERGRLPASPSAQWQVAGCMAFNHAMTMATGDFITHLDDDDEHMPDRLEKLVGLAYAQQCDLIWHPFLTEAPDGKWTLNPANDFVHAQVTTSSVFYRTWFTRIEGNPRAYLVDEPGDWNRFRRIKYLKPVSRRYPEPLLRHYRERTQHTTGGSEAASG
jgi:glycosyltransferase involved in cell wall biosynthesis